MVTSSVIIMVVMLIKWKVYLIEHGIYARVLTVKLIIFGGGKSRINEKLLFVYITANWKLVLTNIYWNNKVSSDQEELMMDLDDHSVLSSSKNQVMSVMANIHPVKSFWANDSSQIEPFFTNDSSQAELPQVWVNDFSCYSIGLDTKRLWHISASYFRLPR